MAVIRDQLMDHIAARDGYSSPEPAEMPPRRQRFSIREILPPHDPGAWPQGFTASREQIYDDTGRPSGGS